MKKKNLEVVKNPKKFFISLNTFVSAEDGSTCMEGIKLHMKLGLFDIFEYVKRW